MKVHCYNYYLLMILMYKCFYSDDVDSDSDSVNESEWCLMDKGGVIEGALIELSHEHQLSVAVCHFF